MANIPLREEIAMGSPSPTVHWNIKIVKSASDHAERLGLTEQEIRQIMVSPVRTKPDRPGCIWHVGEDYAVLLSTANRVLLVTTASGVPWNVPIIPSVRAKAEKLGLSEADVQEVIDNPIRTIPSHDGATWHFGRSFSVLITEIGVVSRLEEGRKESKPVGRPIANPQPVTKAEARRIRVQKKGEKRTAKRKDARDEFSGVEREKMNDTHERIRQAVGIWAVELNADLSEEEIRAGAKADYLSVNGRKFKDESRHQFEAVMVNYLRHNHTSYDKIRKGMKGDYLFVAWKIRVLDEIARTYPFLAKECERQKVLAELAY